MACHLTVTSHFALCHTLWYLTHMSITVQWPSITATHAEVWVVLHLSGMAKSVRQAKDLAKRGLVQLNGGPVDLRTKVAIGEFFTLEILSGVRKGSEIIKLVEREYYEGRNQRQNGPRQEYRRG